nr:reverse transcriptase domain-containing protein [Tanacetum cinerariifolium]GEZ73904.1 reverse transcriptase domain-containing protein [Tanacetum cinerariifolium]
MAASAIIISSDSFDESVGSPPSRVILFGDIPTVIPSTSVIAPETSTTAPVISYVAHVVETTILASPTGLCGLVLYSDLDSDSPDEMASPETLMLLPLPVGGAGSPMDSSPVHSLGLDAPGQAHSGSSTRVVSSRLGYPSVRAPRHSEALFCWCAAPLSTFYPPTTSESSSGDSSERPMHSSSHSVGPSRKRCRSLTDFVPSSTPVTGSLAPTYANLLPPLVLGIDPRSVLMVDEEIVEPVRGDSSSSSGTRDGTVRSVEDIPVDLDGAILEFYHHMSELINLMTEVYYLRNEIQKMETELWNLSVKNNDMATYTQRFQELTMMCTKMVLEEEDRVEKFIGGLPDNIQGNVIATEPTRLQDAVRIANNLMDKKLKGYAVKNAKNKRTFDTNHRDKRPNQKVVTCFECGAQGYYRNNYPKVKNQNRMNKERVPYARGKAYILGGGDANSGSNTVKGTFLLNDHHAYMLFDSGADRSFVSTTFSTLLDITPSALDVSYAVELADGRTLETSTVLRGCTLGLLGHPFNIDLMPIDLGSFDVITGMDWLAKNHAVIVYDEKIVRIPYENEILIVQGDKNDEKKSMLSSISCVKAHKYIEK